jgi:hypothetical protein
MRPVSVRIMHPDPGPDGGPLANWVAGRRAILARRLCAGFEAAGGTDVRILSGPPDDRPFGRRLRDLVRAERPAGLVVLGSGAIPLARPMDLAAFVGAAADERRMALANNRYSADVVAIAHAEGLADVPDLPVDNALPRWLDEVAGYEVRDLRRRWRLAIDVDGPLELALLGDDDRSADDTALANLVDARVSALRTVASNRRAELLVSGRTSPATLAWLERSAAARVRAQIEERGLRAASRLAQAHDPAEAAPRRPASLLGITLDRDGPESLGRHLARLADGAFVDSRVLLAHRLGPDERDWPAQEDRFASDLLLADRIEDPWLRELTQAARDAPIPVLLGGHSLVGPGIRLVLRSRRSNTWT